MSASSTLVKVLAGVAGAGLVYGLATRDTSHVNKSRGSSHDEEPFSTVLNKIRRISPKKEEKFRQAIQECRELVKQFKEKTGAPGVVIGVSVDGEIIWEEGVGYANVETLTPCHALTSMRIASISKPITMALLASMWEKGQIDIDKPVQEYVPYFPFKKFDGKEVTITTRQLASHVSGIRHYKKKHEKDLKKDGNESDSGTKEFYIKERFENLQKSMDIFKDDELFFEPGTSYLYTTHGYTVLSAVIEGAAKKPFTDIIPKVFKTLGLNNTHLDELPKIISNRSSYYTKNKKGVLVNAELTDNSYKWAGGGFVSTVEDLLKFGNAMLYCYQQTKEDKPGFLKKETIQEMWTPVKNTSMPSWGRNAGYGLGWIIAPELDDIGGVEKQKFCVGHGGGAVGASSMLFIFPKPDQYDENGNIISRNKPPQGVTVAVLINLESVSSLNLASETAKVFAQYI